jgi:hypothetical protein
MSSKPQSFSVDDFLGGFLGDGAVALPTGEGFAPGFIGPVMAAVKWFFWDSSNLDDDPEDFGGHYTKRGREGSFFYYFDDRALADKAAEHMRKEFKSQQVWRFEIPTLQILNMGMDSPEATWGNSVGGDARIHTLASKRRHEFHMMSLPAAINALAVRVGAIPASAFDISDLNDNPVFDEDYHARMIGGEGEFPWQQSELWLRRDALWKMLGEEDATAHSPIGTGSKHDTKSEVLSKLLGIVARPWKAPVWGRLLLVKNPDVKAISSSGSRFSVPALVDIYANEKAAQTAAEEGGSKPRETMSAQVTAPVATSPVKASPAPATGNKPPLPAVWKDYAKEWVTELQTRKQASKPAPLLESKDWVRIATELSCTVDELQAWWNSV